MLVDLSFTSYLGFALSMHDHQSRGSKMDLPWHKLILSCIVRNWKENPFLQFHFPIPYFLSPVDASFIQWNIWLASSWDLQTFSRLVSPQRRWFFVMKLFSGVCRNSFACLVKAVNVSRWVSEQWNWRDQKSIHCFHLHDQIIIMLWISI